MTDELYEEAAYITCKEKYVSTSLLQRRLHITYSRAVSLIDQMLKDGLIDESTDGRLICGESKRQRAAREKREREAKAPRLF